MGVLSMLGEHGRQHGGAGAVWPHVLHRLCGEGDGRCCALPQVQGGGHGLSPHLLLTGDWDVVLCVCDVV